MTIDPVALLRRYHAALQPYDRAAVAGMFAPGAVYLSPGVNGRLEGRAAILAAFEAYFAEYPDQQAEDEEITSISPFAARAVWRLAAKSVTSGRRVERRGIERVFFDAGGLITRVEVEDR